MLNRHRGLAVKGCQRTQAAQGGHCVKKAAKTRRAREITSVTAQPQHRIDPWGINRPAGAERCNQIVRVSLVQDRHSKTPWLEGRHVPTRKRKRP